MIESKQNPLIKLLKKLHHSSDRKSQGRFLVEGTHSVQEALAVHWPIESLFYTERWRERNEIDLDCLPTNLPCHLVSSSVLKTLATTEEPDGVVAIALMEKDPTFSQPISLAVAVDGLQSPGNLGTLIRSVAASGGDGVYLGEGSVDATNPKVLRSSAGLWFKNPPMQVDLKSWLASCKSNSVQILSSVAGGKSLWEFDLTQPTVFILGNEGAGISKEIATIAHDVISIPMQPGVESLNVGMSGTLLMYEAARQRRKHT